ncbi:hypothetical protein LCGC14_0622680 [marine sediment metagenome]|uniref:Uncharacterized protein n=1 Tax=marine sediment metagenome TaxID=412755 RepID=A0A0F9RNQ4_9ZZZZ
MGSNNNDGGFSLEFGSLAIALLFIAFWGEPDLVDALIQYFMRACGA